MYRSAVATLVALMGAQVTTALPIQKAILVDELEAYEGDVTDVRTVRRVESHPDAWRVWQPVIAQWKGRHLVVAFGAMVHGKKDMGDIFVSVSKNDGDTWSEPVVVFDHNRRQGAIQFAYANPVLFKPPNQDVLWCFAMRCPIAYRNSEDSQLAAPSARTAGTRGRQWNWLCITRAR